jgi:transposase
VITVHGNVRVWLATGHTDMRRGFRSLALMVHVEAT